MDVYLVQHGLAMSKAEDASRPLSATGRKEVERVARAAAAAGLRPGSILHSGKTRALQTAEIFAGRSATEPAVRIVGAANLSAEDDVAGHQTAPRLSNSPSISERIGRGSLSVASTS